MRCGYLILFALPAAGCGFHSSAGAPDASLPVPDSRVLDMRSFGPGELAAGQLIDMTFDAARGSLTPNAYTYGGLVAHGLAGMHLWDHDHTTWMSPATANATTAGLWRGDGFGTADRLDHLGVVNDQTMTVWFEGEVWLDATFTEVFGLVGDDLAFVDLARPGTVSFTRVMLSEPAASTASAPVATPDTGWYPIRIGFANGDGTLSFAFTHSDGTGPQIAWTRDRLRARTSGLSGALRTVFFHQILGGGDLGKLPISHVDDGTLLQATFPDPALQGAQTTNDNWSARYAAQVYVAQAGSYTLKAVSDDGNEIWFGGQAKNSTWSFGVGNPNATSMATAALAAGWNDLIVDYNQVGGARKLQVQLTGGGLNGTDIPHAQLRPVEPTLDRLAFGSDDTSRNVQDNNGPTMPAVATMTVDAYAGFAPETVTSIDVTYEVDSPHWNELRFDLESPTKRVNIASGAGVANGDSIGHTSIPAGTGGPPGQLLNGPASGTWKLDVYDIQDSGSTGDSTLKSVKLTLHTRGGPDKIARTASWTSQVIDATAPVIAIDGITWTERVPGGAGVQVRFRACQQADCSDATWSGPVIRATPFGVTPGRYLQLRVDMTSNGTLEPELQSLAIMFRRSA